MESFGSLKVTGTVSTGYVEATLSDTRFVALCPRGCYFIYAICFQLLKCDFVFSLRSYTFSVSYSCPSIFYSPIVLFARPDELQQSHSRREISFLEEHVSFLPL